MTTNDRTNKWIISERGKWEIRGRKEQFKHATMTQLKLIANYERARFSVFAFMGSFNCDSAKKYFQVKYHPRFRKLRIYYTMYNYNVIIMCINVQQLFSRVLTAVSQPNELHFIRISIILFVTSLGFYYFSE